ncbi:hypothetical protein MWU49_15670 [Alcanivorax sp. S6407]|uniref:porin n=1 Tax=Alcanivorax sp. S6407 TaxID=2926424 RepID=UPI001FF3C7AE|nr:porin [Alcanivorax sp. S6407]MCK0155153.1 hypothetical protein [Alcanivorax sp. S6407]
MRLPRGLLWGAVWVASGGAFASDAASLNDLEERLYRLEQDATSTSPSDNWTDRVSINGFVTYGLTRHNVHEKQGAGIFPNPEQGKPFYYLDTLSDEVSHRELSRVGLQFDVKVNDRTSAVVQILGQAIDNYDAEVQWAFVDYELLPGLHWRGGRLVLPTFMHSQYLNVGYAYHWAALPSEVYGTVPFDTFDGMDLTWSVNTGPLSHELSAFYGGVDLEDGDPPVTVDYELRNYMGANLRSSWGSLNSWLSYTESTFTADFASLGLPSASLDKEVLASGSIGLGYDNGSFMLMAERSYYDSDNWIPDRWGGYVSTGYRFGKWMPHLTWGATNSTGLGEVLEEGDPAKVFLAQQSMVRSKSWTYGLRYDLAPGVDVKLEAQTFYDMSTSSYRQEGANLNGMFTSSVSAGEIDTDDPTVYRLSVDAVF